MSYKRPDGYRSIAEGAIWQQRVVDAYKEDGYPDVWVGWSHDQPDLVIFIPDVPPIVIAVKSFTLVPSAERRGPDGRLSYASARTVTREHVAPEINYSLQAKAALCVLTVINQRNGVAEHIELHPEVFTSYTTSQRLNDNRGNRNLAIWDFADVVALERNDQQGWLRIANPNLEEQEEQTD